MVDVWYQSSFEILKNVKFGRKKQFKNSFRPYIRGEKAISRRDFQNRNILGTRLATRLRLVWLFSAQKVPIFRAPPRNSHFFTINEFKNSFLSVGVTKFYFLHGGVENDYFCAFYSFFICSLSLIKFKNWKLCLNLFDFCRMSNSDHLFFKIKFLTFIRY